jgi:hypothetical protein
MIDITETAPMATPIVVPTESNKINIIQKGQCNSVTMIRTIWNTKVMQLFFIKKKKKDMKHGNIENKMKNKNYHSE